MEILTLSQYEEKGFEEVPSGKGWVNYGDDNLYPQYLVDLYKCSATHNALCNSISMMIFGRGVVSDDLDAKLKIQEWDLEDEVRKACLDLKIQGGFALEIIYSIDRTTISKIRHLPFENLRSGEVNDREECEFYFYSRDWSDKRVEPESIAAFNPDKAKQYPCQVLYVKPFAVGSFYYPKPDYIGSINYIELDKEISKYHINNIKNGLAPSFTIHFKNGTPPVEERTRIRMDIENQLAGATNAGKFIVTYSDQPDRKPDFEPFPLSDADKQYQFLSTEVTDKIMVGHRVVSPAMFGVKTAGQLGSTQELEVASQLFNRQVIEPYQRVVNKALRSIFNACGLTSIVRIGKSEPIRVEASEELQRDAEVESFKDYGEGVRNNAKRGIELNKKNGNKCATQTGKVRAQQLSNGEPISLETVKRMYSYLSRAEDDYDENDTKACGTISYLLWGGKAGLAWSRNKLDELGEIELHEKYDLSASSNYLHLNCEFMDEDDYTLIDSRRVDYDTNDTQDAMWTFAKAIEGEGTEGKDSQDNDLIKVRYAYMPRPEKLPRKGVSRDFCQKMMNMGANAVWSKAAIEKASGLSVNKGWGKGGADNYDIWLYKGGGSCQHYWERRTFLKKGNKRISVKRAKAIIKEAGLAPLAVNDRKVAKRPRDMAGRGFVDGRGNWTNTDGAN